MKTETIKIRCLPEEKEAWEKKATARGLSFSEWVRLVLNDAVDWEIEFVKR